jgi:hypothetical protein
MYHKERVGSHEITTLYGKCGRISTWEAKEKNGRNEIMPKMS